MYKYVVYHMVIAIDSNMQISNRRIGRLILVAVHTHFECSTKTHLHKQIGTSRSNDKRYELVIFERFVWNEQYFDSLRSPNYFYSNAHSE